MELQQVVLPRKFRTTSNYIPSLPTPPTNAAKNEPKHTNGNGSISSEKSIASSSTSSSLSEDTTATAVAGVNDSAQSHLVQSAQQQPHGLLLTRQALHTYQSNDHLVYYKYSAYSGTYHDLPRYYKLFISCYRFFFASVS